MTTDAAGARSAMLAGGQVLLLGDLDVAYPLREQGVAVTAIRSRSDPTRFSRAGITWSERPDDPAALAGRLIELARRHPGPTVLFVQGDHDLAVVSRHRAELRQWMRFLLPRADVLDVLLDKGRFQAAAQAHGLPVPGACVVSTAFPPDGLGALPLPAVVKPLLRRRDGTGDGLAGGKGLLVRDHDALGQALTRLAESYDQVLVQQLVEGPESRVESYHAYIDGAGRVHGEFTGRKLRTDPAMFGFSTALMTTHSDDVLELGRRTVAAFSLSGFQKIDCKRDTDGRLWLLEVNARCTLWHRLGASAGCNLPVLAYRDLLGASPPMRPVPARAGVTWSRQPRDLIVARRAGVPLFRYLRWLKRCEAVAGFRFRDPWPFLRGSLGSLVSTWYRRRQVRAP